MGILKYEWWQAVLQYIYLCNSRVQWSSTGTVSQMSSGSESSHQISRKYSTHASHKKVNVNGDEVKGLILIQEGAIMFIHYILIKKNENDRVMTSRNDSNKDSTFLRCVYFAEFWRFSNSIRRITTDQKTGCVERCHHITFVRSCF
jgi:hypothetical protein